MDLLHTHTQYCLGWGLYTDMPLCDFQMVGFSLFLGTFICVEKLGEKYKNPTNAGFLLFMNVMVLAH